MRVAPVVHLLLIIFDEKAAYQLPEIVSESKRTIGRFKQTNQSVGNVVSVGFPEFRRNHLTPGQRLAEILRFVREKTCDCFAKFFLEPLIVFFVCTTDKLPRHLRIEQVDIRMIVTDIYVIIDRFSLLSRNAAIFLPDKHIRCERICTISRFFFQFQICYIIPLFQKFSPCKTARPPVFVVKPNVHSEFFCLVDGGFHQAEPLLGQILRFQPAPRMKKKSADPLFVHKTDLFPQPPLLQFVVQRIKGNAAIIFLLHFIQIHDRFLLI